MKFILDAKLVFCGKLQNILAVFLDRKWKKVFLTLTLKIS